MAKGIMQEWAEDEDKLFLLESWSRSGLTDIEIAENIGIDVRTLYRWKKKDSRISQSLKRGKEVADYKVENALYESAIGGNVVAQIFWLKNRKPNDWRDKQSTEISGESRVMIVDDVPDS